MALWQDIPLQRDKKSGSDNFRHNDLYSKALKHRNFFAARSVLKNTPGILFLCSILLFSSCKGPHGQSPEQWFAILESGQPLPEALNQKPDFKAISRLGDGALVFLAMHSADRGLARLERDFLVESVKREKGIFRERALALLLKNLSRMDDPLLALSFSKSRQSASLPEESIFFLEAEALLKLGRYNELSSLLERRGDEWLGTEGRQKFIGYRAMAALAEEKADWLDAFRVLLAGPADEWLYGVLDKLAEGSLSLPPQLQPSPDEILTARARVLTAARDYGGAVRLYRQIAVNEETVTRLTEKEIVDYALTLERGPLSDMARAFLYGSRAEAYDAFSSMAGLAPGDEKNAYLRLYWAGRFARDAGKWKDAESFFFKALEYADNPTDLDASLWYSIEAARKLDTKTTLANMDSALRLSQNPGYFSDHLEAVSRQALLANDGQTLLALSIMAEHASSADHARLSYLAARAAMEGIIKEAELSRAGFEKSSFISASLELAMGQDSDIWYRLAASWWLSPSILNESAQNIYFFEDSAGPSDEELAWAEGLLRFGLYNRLRLEEFAYQLPEGLLLAAVTKLVEKNDNAGGIRLASILARRNSINDYKAFWPTPWLELFQEEAAINEINPAVLYGLARSESLFAPTVVSSAGAIGLAQLMPATAEETAQRLRMESYNLDDPADNLHLGAAYFKRMLGNVEGKLFEALSAYNAGLSRMRGWKARAPRLPQDLLIESLEFAETRQYCKNVATAAVMYASIYGFMEPAALFSLFMGD